MKTKLLLTALTFLFFFTSCNKDDETQTIPTQPTGKVAGKVMVKNGLKPVGGALVFVMSDSNKMYSTHTDAAGNFTLDAPAGNRKLEIQTGGGSNFRTTVAVTIVTGQTISIGSELTRLDQVARMAYVAGEYDDIQSIVTSLGYVIEPLTNAGLADYATVAQYDIIFLNCGAKEAHPSQATIDTNLANFVTNGGSLYVSDWAVAYLTGGNTNSQICSETNGFIPDDKLCAKNTGGSTTIMGAQVTYANLAASLGFSTLDIQYDLGSWEQIFNYEPAFWDVLVSDPATNKPLMIKTNNFSAGTVLAEVGNNADDDWITICHHETDGEPITITILSSDWAAHEAHGDSLGECLNANNSGTIYYTTFHNHAGGNIANTGLILQYVILNL